MTGRITACRVCSCTDERACAGGCGWIQSGLCSACLGDVRRAACPESSCKSTGKWCRRPSGHSGPMAAFHRARIDAAAAARKRSVSRTVRAVHEEQLRTGTHVPISGDKSRPKAAAR